MAGDLIPEDIKEFVLQHVDSIAHLEALLLLRRETDQKWDARRVAKRLYLNVPETANVLARLHARGFLATEGDVYWYCCTPEERALAVERVAEFYARHLIPITNLIHSKPASRIQEFADAFKLRKDD